MCAVDGPPGQEAHTKEQSVSYKQPGAVALQKLEQPVNRQPGHHRRRQDPDDEGQRSGIGRRSQSILQLDDASDSDRRNAEEK